MENTPTTMPATAECASGVFKPRADKTDEWSGLNRRIAHTQVQFG